MVESGRRASVSVAGDGIEIGRLQIYMDGKRTSHIKNTILEAKFDEASTIEQTGIGKRETRGWKIVRDSMSGTSMSSLQRAPSRSSLTGRVSRTSIGAPRGSKLSLSGATNKMAIRKSNCNVIMEENNGLGALGLSPSSPMQRPGWRVLRESIKRKEFNENLQVRKSTLQLHSMDELAFNRHSQLSLRKPSIRKSQHNNRMDPSQGRYGYQETNVATMRRQSIAGAQSNSRSSSLEHTDSDLMRLVRTSREKQIESEKLRRSRCLCLPRIYCKA